MSARVRRMCDDHRWWSNGEIASWFGVDPYSVRRWRLVGEAVRRGETPSYRGPIGHSVLMPGPVDRFGKTPVHDHGDTIKFGLRGGMLDRYDARPTDPRCRIRSLCADALAAHDIEALREQVTLFARQLAEPVPVVTDWLQPLTTRFAHVQSMLDALPT